MASSRFPGKPLTPILELPMVEHVRRRALLCDAVDETYVATCDQEIMDVVSAAGGNAVMTASTHQRCTERVEEAMRSIHGDIAVIVQGDEPLLVPDAIREVVRPLINDPEIQCTNLLSPISDERDFADVNVVKAACDQRGDLMFLSRAPIPVVLKEGPCPVYRQTGVMAFRREFLEMYTALPETPFERAESIDMLRLLEHGHRVAGVPVDYAMVGVDHERDVAIVEELLRSDPEQSTLYQTTLRA
jgi:3-deoxy-manno-octulosonate cytidylyltransferase (CMP-KDO synthetase)